MSLFDWATKGRGTARLVVTSALLALGLVLVVWVGNRATRRELLTLLRNQAVSLRQTVAAAARSNFEGGKQAASELESRMLNSARLMAQLDERGILDEKFLDETANRSGLFRVTVYGPDRTPELSSDSGGPRRGFGPGFARGYGGDLLDRLMDEEDTEEVTDIHVSRWGDWRGFAAVRRSGGGAILLNVDASAIESLRGQTSLDALLADVVESASEVAYVIFEEGGLRITHGDVPDEPSDETPYIEFVEGSTEDLRQRELAINGEPVLEFSGPIVMDETTEASLRLGMHLDGLRQAEQRMLWQLALSLGASLALAGLGVGTVWLQRKYSLLSARHELAREALRRRDRLAAMGELSSTVAHEIRNPLNAIAMSAKRLRREFMDLAKVKDEDQLEADELLGVLEAETQRINQRVQQFLDFARPPRLAPRRIDLAELVRELAEGSRAMAADQEVELDVNASDTGDVYVDPGQIQQALDNMVRNAIEATPEGGHVRLNARRHSGGYEIVVVDSGSGIEPEDLPRLFDLYFTTKSDGTGVGLAVTQQIVAAHGGTIEVESQMGHGTRMTILLPRAIEKPNR